jgi:DNA-binding MarR family transcriptional regulator
MRIIDEIAEQYPQLDLASIQILLTIYEYPGYCIREIAQVVGMDPKTCQEKVTMLSGGRKGKKWTRLGLVSDGYKVSDQRMRDLMLTQTGRDLAEKLSLFLRES